MVGIRGRGEPPRARCARHLVALAGAVLACLFAASSAFSAPLHPTASDKTATLAYIRALSAFERARVEGLPAAVSAARTQATRLQSECPRVLAGAPTRSTFGPLGPGPPPSGRAQGEADRLGRQLGYLDEELFGELFAPIGQAERGGVAAFAASVLSLRWSDPKVAAAVRGEVEADELAGPLPHVCADMRYWAATGFKEVSPATREFVHAEAARIGAGREPVEPRLVPYENAAARRALTALRRLDQRAAVIERPLFGVEQSVRDVLGMQRDESPILHERPGTLVARGRTAAGQRWAARLRHGGGGCTFEVQVVSQNGEGGGSEGWCLSRRQKRAEPSVNCNEGLLTISSLTRPRTTLVRLRLSDGRSITSAPIRIPPRLGGPLGIYYQVVRGPSPIPRSLTELDAAGRVLRVTHLPAIVECTRNPLKYLPGGHRTLATGTVPGGGPGFSIVSERYRFLGKVYVELRARVEAEPHSLFGTFFGGSSHSFGFGPAPLRQAVSIKEETGCEPHPYEILFGLLHDPGEVLSAHAGGATVPLAAVALPASLHTRGELVYGAFSPPATSLSLRKKAGATVATEPLETKEFVERCEGEAEPGGPLL